MNIQIQKADARDLRSELDATIQIQRTADDCAERATNIAAKAERHLRVARDNFEHAEAAHREKTKRATERRAKTIAEDLRAGNEPGLYDAAETLECSSEADIELGYVLVLEIAAAELAAERDRALTEASAAPAPSVESTAQTPAPTSPPEPEKLPPKAPPFQVDPEPPPPPKAPAKPAHPGANMPGFSEHLALKAKEKAEQERIEALRKM